MDTKLIIWLTVLCTGVSIWFYLSTDVDINYEKFPFLVDPVSGQKRKPHEMMNLMKVINVTEDYINSTDAQARTYELFYNVLFEQMFTTNLIYSKEEDLKVSGWPVSNQTLCANHLNWILSQINTNRNYTFLKGRLGFELTRYMNSFGYREPGLTDWQGSYEQCQKASLNNKLIKTRFCWAGMRPKWWPKNETIYPLPRMRIGVCLPETCDTSSFPMHKKSIETLMKLELPEMYKNGLDFETLFCLPDERSPIRQLPLSGRIYLTIVGSWIALVLIATILYEILRIRSTRKTNQQICFSSQREKCANIQLAISQDTLLDNLLQALSLRCSVKSLKFNKFRVKYTHGEKVRVNLAPLDLAKFLMAIIIVIWHSIFIMHYMSMSQETRVDTSTGAFAQSVILSLYLMETFYVFFGLLLTYTMMRKFSIQQLSSPLCWLQVNFFMLLGMTPIYLLVFWYSRSISPYMGSGPWWDYAVDKNSLKGTCQSDPWWISIPHFGKLGTITAPACLPPAWFIVNYVHLALIVPLLTFVLCKLPNYFSRYCLVGFLMLVSTTTIAIRASKLGSLGETGLNSIGLFMYGTVEKFEPLGYTMTIIQLGATSMGCLIGFLLREYEVGKIQKWPKYLSNKWTVITTIILTLLIFSLPSGIRIVGLEVTKTRFIMTNFTMMILYPMVHLILILTLTTVYNDLVVMRFLGHTIWHSLNRLGYGIFLIHWEIIFITTNSFERGPGHGFFLSSFVIGVYAIFPALFISFFLYIFIQAPLEGLINMLFVYSQNKTMSTIREEEEEEEEARLEMVLDKNMKSCSPIAKQLALEPISVETK